MPDLLPPDVATGAALRRAILERPGDRDNWLVYADWLEDAGHGVASDSVRGGQLLHSDLRLLMEPWCLESPVLCSVLRLNLADLAEGAACEVFSRHPVVRVETDRRPGTSGGATWWVDSGHDMGRDYELPAHLFKRLEGHKKANSGPMRCRDYRTVEEAHAALSDAIVAWGRELVGLPALTRTP